MARSGRLRLLVVQTVIAAGVAGAAARPLDFEGRTSTWVAPENPKCTCRYKGEHLPLGTRRCLQTPKGLRTAECVTEQNVTSWRPTDEPCPQARLEHPRPNP